MPFDGQDSLQQLYTGSPDLLRQALQFNFAPALYTHPDKVTRLCTLDRALVDKAMTTGTGRAILSRKLLEAANLGSKPVLDFSTPLRRMALQPYDSLTHFARIAGLALMHNVLSKVVDGMTVRKLVGDARETDLSLAIKIGRTTKNALPSSPSADSSPSQLASDCLAAWLLSEEDSVRARVLLKFPPGHEPLSCRTFRPALAIMAQLAEHMEADHA